MSSEIENLYKQAEKAEKSHDFEVALECYQKILGTDPQEDHAYYGLANVYAIRGLVSQVVQQYLRLADVLEGKGQLDGALEVCQWVISIEPGGTQSRLKLIDLLEKQSKRKDAERQALILSRIFSALGHGEQAVDLLQKRRELDPDNPELALQLGEIYIKQGQIAEGIALYKTIARELLNRRDYSRALDALRRIKALRNEDLENLSSLGEVYIYLGKLEEAKAEFRLILRQDLNHIGALSQLGLIAKLQGAWDEARLPFRKIVELDPGNAYGRECFAEVNEVLGNPTEAIKHYLIAGEIYEKNNENDKAVEVYQNILALDLEHIASRSRLEALGGAPVPRSREAVQAARRKSEVAARPAHVQELEEPSPVQPAMEADAAEEVPAGDESRSSKWVLSERQSPKPILTRLREQPPQGKEGRRQDEEAPQPVANLVPEIELPQPDRVVEAEAPQSEIETPAVVVEPDPEPVAQQPEPIEEISAPSEPEPEVATAAAAPEQVEEPRGAESHPPGIPETPELRSARQLYSQGKVSAAIQKCKEALKGNDDGLGWETLLAEICFESGLLEEALGYYKDLVSKRKDPVLLQKLAELNLFLGNGDDWLEASLARATLLRGAGQVQEAMEEAGRVLAASPNNIKARQLFIAVLKEQALNPLAIYHQRLLVESLESSNALGDLIPVYLQLLDSKPDALPIRYKLALCYQELGKVAEAKIQFLLLSTHYGARGERDKEADHLSRALELDPADEGIMQRLRDVYAHLGRKLPALELEMRLGDFALAQGNGDDALASFNKVLEADPDNIECLARVTDLYIKRKAGEKALESGKRLGDLYVKQKESRKAVELYQNLLRLEPENLSLHRGLASLFSQENQPKEALQEFVNLGHLAANKAQFDDALDAYRQVLTLDPSNKDARYQMGVILADHKNNLDAALAEFKKVRSLDPHHAAALSRLAKGYAAQGDLESALPFVNDLIRLDPANKALLDEFSRELETRLQKDPENAALHFSYGVLCRQTGRLKEAISEFQLVAKKSPELALRAYAYQGYCWEEKAVLENDESLYPSALKVYKKGLDTKGYKDEDYLELKYALAKLHETTGKLQEAIPLYQEVLAVDMEYKDARDRKKQLEEEISSGKVTRLPASRRQESAP